jgi:multidrug efflux pump subunit AcrB
MAQVDDSVENIRNGGQANGKRSVLVIIYLQPNANVIRIGRPDQGAAAEAAGGAAQ